MIRYFSVLLSDVGEAFVLICDSNGGGSDISRRVSDARVFICIRSCMWAAKVIQATITSSHEHYFTTTQDISIIMLCEQYFSSIYCLGFHLSHEQEEELFLYFIFIFFDDM